MLAYNYNNNVNMGGQSQGLGRYAPPMFGEDGRPINQGQGGYAYNLPTNNGPYQGAFGGGQGAPMPQFQGGLKQYMQNILSQQGYGVPQGGNYPQGQVPAYGNGPQKNNPTQYQGQMPDQNPQQFPTFAGNKGTPMSTQGPMMDTGPQGGQSQYGNQMGSQLDQYMSQMQGQSGGMSGVGGMGGMLNQSQGGMMPSFGQAQYGGQGNPAAQAASNELMQRINRRQPSSSPMAFLQQLPRMLGGPQ